jgi:hypothetical protein
MFIASYMARKETTGYVCELWDFKSGETSDTFVLKTSPRKGWGILELRNLLEKKARSAGLTTGGEITMRNLENLKPEGALIIFESDDPGMEVMERWPNPN